MPGSLPATTGIGEFREWIPFPAGVSAAGGDTCHPNDVTAWPKAIHLLTETEAGGLKRTQ